MKGCRAAAGVLLLILLAVLGNALFVRGVSDRMTEAVDTLPPIPDPQATPAAVEAIRRDYEGVLPYLSVTINYSTLARVGELLRSLERYAAAGDDAQYAATLATLRALIADLGRGERPAAENLF